MNYPKAILIVRVVIFSLLIIGSIFEYLTMKLKNQQIEDQNQQIQNQQRVIDLCSKRRNVNEIE